MNSNMDIINRMKTLMSQKAKAVGVEDLLNAVVLLGLVAIVAAVVALILQNFSTTQFATSNIACNANNLCAALNSINFGLSSIQTMTSFMPLIALVIVAAIIIGIVLLAFAFRGAGRTERF